MPLKIPDLDDRRFTDLVEEGRSLMTRNAAEWTNHNPSDPGITLIELLAYFTEILIYRLNRVTRANKIKFLQLLRNVDQMEKQYLSDPDTPIEYLERTLEKTILKIREPRRAVTREDYEHLAKKITACILLEDLKTIRTRCFPGQNLEAEDKSRRMHDCPGHISVIILPGNDLEPDEMACLVRQVHKTLNPMCLLTSRLHVIEPFYIWLSIGAEIRIESGVSFPEVRRSVIKKLYEFFNPLSGGEMGRSGWEFGRSVYLFEIWALLEKIEYIDSVRNVKILHLAETQYALENSQSAFGLQIGVRSTLGIDSRLGGESIGSSKRIIRDSSGTLTGIRLNPYELVRIDIREADITSREILMTRSSPREVLNLK